MKKISLILLALLLPLVFFGQVQDNGDFSRAGFDNHGVKDVSISLVAPNMLLDNRLGTLPGAGLKMRVFVAKRFSFDSDLILGRDYLHFGPGIAGLPLWMLASGAGLGFSGDNDNSLTEFLIMGALMLLSAEHFAYHAPVAKGLEISPYLSLLRFKQLNDVMDSESPDGTVSSANAAIGLEINKYVRRMVISAYADFETAYNGSGQGVNLGFCVGYYIRGD